MKQNKQQTPTDYKDPEFFYYSGFKSNSQIAREQGVNESTIRYWRKKAGIKYPGLPFEDVPEELRSCQYFIPFPGKALIISDVHCPFEDKQAYDIMLRVGEDFAPNEIVILGDFGDFHAVSSHGATAGLKIELNEEIEYVKNKLADLRFRFPNAKIVFLEGNHEYRLARYILGNAPALEGAMTTESVLSLKELDIAFIPYGPDQKYQVLGSKLYARHEPLGGGQNMAKTTIDKGLCSMVFGHHHTIQEHRKVSFSGKDYRAFTPGWLGDASSNAFSYRKMHAQWQHGFALVNTDENGNFFHQIIHIMDGKTMFNGRTYE